MAAQPSPSLKSLPGSPGFFFSSDGCQLANGQISNLRGQKTSVTAVEAVVVHSLITCKRISQHHHHFQNLLHLKFFTTSHRPDSLAAITTMESIARNQATVALIQHLEDAPLNPLTGTIWPPGHNDLLQARRRLPVYGQYQEILGAYHQSQVVILSSKTGTGKSTQVPQLLVYDEYESGLQIACTQPRKLATKELASRVANEMGVVLGQEVGYKIRNHQKFTKQTTRLTYMTEGVLLRQLGSDKNLSAYACVVLDEAHERTTNLDLLLALLKKIIRHRTDFKVSISSPTQRLSDLSNAWQLVIMSATLDARLFQDYFDGCPLVHIDGRNFDVEICYASGLGTSFVTAAASMVVKIHKDQKPGDILTFLPGEDELGQVCELVRQHTIDLDVFPLHSSLSASDQMLALSSSGPNRKCIVSTNIAETSLTVDNVIYVVGTGLSRQLIYNPRLRLHMLEIRPISQASARQRAGRAGRTRDGICYRPTVRKLTTLWMRPPSLLSVAAPSTR
jgi:pre-mRNA-splicing factor ATP-dependent RNA helicase DHX15/PRP43